MLQLRKQRLRLDKELDAGGRQAHYKGHGSAISLRRRSLLLALNLAFPLP